MNSSCLFLIGLFFKLKSGFNSENCESNDEEEDDNTVFKNKRLIKLPVNNLFQYESHNSYNREPRIVSVDNGLYSVPAESIHNVRI